MHRFSRAAVAAATTTALVGGLAAPAGAEVRERDAVQYFKQTCTWLVDAQGNPQRDTQGNPIPSRGSDGKQKCTLVAVDAAEVGGGSSRSASSEPPKPGDLQWVDEEPNKAAEMSVGVIVGVVGAVVAAIVGIGLLFVEDLNVRLMPPPPKR